MKRTKGVSALAITASLAMVVGMGGCGRSDNGATSESDAVTIIDSSKATGDLTVWAMGNEGDLLGDFVKDFEKENPEVHVKVTAFRGLPRMTNCRPRSPREMARMWLRWVPHGWRISPIHSLRFQAISIPVISPKVRLERARWTGSS